MHFSVPAAAGVKRSVVAGGGEEGEGGGGGGHFVGIDAVHLLLDLQKESVPVRASA